MVSLYSCAISLMMLALVAFIPGNDGGRAALKKLVGLGDFGAPSGMDPTVARVMNQPANQVDERVEACVSDQTRMYVVILDELDQLLSKHQQVLYSLFEWAAAPGSKLILVGIANALDLTERFLPRLRARGATPRMLNFTPYASDELRSILLQRLASAKLSPVDSNRFGSSDAARHDALIDRNAVDFCCKKVANASGDARRVLEVTRVAVDKALEEIQVCCKDLPSWADKPLIRFEHMSVAVAAAFKSPIISLLASLPQHQQMLLCSLAIRCKRIVARASQQAKAAAEIASSSVDGFLLQGAPRASAKASVAASKRRAGVGGGAVHCAPHRCTLADLHAEYTRVCKSQVCKLFLLSRYEVSNVVRRGTSCSRVCYFHGCC
mmetsp:Transcript_23388/g.53154  ORF Transcript_23388/g.53154 Transcript_23388/m.53154 type:complete len:380 (-) Transcript_23388:463-1602(-)